RGTSGSSTRSNCSTCARSHEKFTWSRRSSRWQRHSSYSCFRRNGEKTETQSERGSIRGSSRPTRCSLRPTSVSRFLLVNPFLRPLRSLYSSLDRAEHVPTNEVNADAEGDPVKCELAARSSVGRLRARLGTKPGQSWLDRFSLDGPHDLHEIRLVERRKRL